MSRSAQRKLPDKAFKLRPLSVQRMLLLSESLGRLLKNCRRISCPNLRNECFRPTVYPEPGVSRPPIKTPWPLCTILASDVRVLFPPEAQGLARGFKQPSWTAGMTPFDFLPLAQKAVSDPWRLRKQLVATLAVRHSVLEYDAQDFTLLHLFVKVTLAVKCTP